MRTFSSKTDKVTCTIGGRIFSLIEYPEMNADRALAQLIGKACPFVRHFRKKSRSNTSFDQLRKNDHISSHDENKKDYMSLAL